MEAAGEVSGVPILSPRLAHLLKTPRGCGMHIGSMPEPDRDFLIYYEERSLAGCEYVLESRL